MKQEEFNKVDKIADVAADLSQEWFACQEMSKIKELLRRVSAQLPAEYSLSLDVELRVFDPAREQSLRLLTTGLCCSEGKEPYVATGDSTRHRYIVDGEICKVPHDFCPHCWGPWDFKLLHPTCATCGYSMGTEVKLLVDSDVCPNCEEGSISINNTTCAQCGVTLDPKFVTWG